MNKTWKAKLGAAGMVAPVALLAVSGALGQGATEKHWSAQWITAAGAGERDEAVLHFRKTIEMAGVPEHFVVHVSADNQFILYVNGREAGRGPSRGDLAHWRYETYDIVQMLHAGKNTLAAIVWNFGKHGAIAQISDRTGFLLHGAGEAERSADTNATWAVEIEKGIETVRPKVKGYYAAEPGLRIDGEKFDWDASRAEEPRTGNWTKAVTLGRGALREERDAPNSWQLMSDALPALACGLINSVMAPLGKPPPIA